MNTKAVSYETTKKTIDGVEYSVTLFPAGPGFQLLFELKEVLGDSMTSLLGQNVESLVSKIGGDLSKAEILDFVIRLLEFTFVSGRTQPIDRDFFNSHFAGKYGHLMKVLSFVVEVNFSDFFDEVKSGLTSLVGRFETLMKDMGATNLGALSQSPKA